MKRTIDYCKNNAKRLMAITCVAIAPLAIGMLATGCAGNKYHESTGDYIDDSATTVRVRHALDEDPTYKYNDVHVSTFKGTVQLSGYVASPEVKTRAQQIARETPGVANVIDSIVVR